jgi:rhamnosyltransferase subunit B
VRAILSAPGSRGDVNPMIAIGERLRSAGHDVVISLAEPYAEIAEAAGLRVEVVIDRERFSELLGSNSVWKPIRGALAVFRQISRDYMPLHQEVIRKHHVPGETVLVSHPLDLVSRVVREADPTTPLVDVHLQPVILRTYDSPPRLSPWWFELSRPEWALRAAYWMVDQVAIDPVIRGPVNRLRASYGLPPIKRVMNEWWLSPDRILAMYPAWFAPATENFCPQLVHCGFPLADVDGTGFEPPTDHPIVFTSGTAHHHCRQFFASAVDACLKLNRPGLLLSTFAENFPADLPGLVRTMPYVSFSQLLPHCSAIVHHGGVGTTSQALAAGIPQVVRPLAFDQFDNATRVERFGCGRWLRRDKDLAETLRAVLEDQSADNSALKQASQRLNEIDAPAVAAMEVEKVFEQSHASPNR